MHFNRISLLFFILFFLVLSPMEVLAESNLNAIIKNASPLKLPYGATTLTIGKNKYMIVRGLFETEGTAWGGDIYTVLLRDHEVWKRVRSKKDSLDSIIVNTIPHTLEDSVKSIRFLMDKEKEKIYLIEAVRHYNPQHLKTPVLIKLYDIVKTNDFDVSLFREVAKGTTTIKYGNVDVALLKELGIAQ